MNKELENYINKLEVVINMKYTVEHMGFVKEDRDYYVKKDLYKIHILFKEEEFTIWIDEHLDSAFVKNYIELYNEIDKGICTPKEFLYRVLNSF